MNLVRLSHNLIWHSLLALTSPDCQHDTLDVLIAHRGWEPGARDPRALEEAVQAAIQAEPKAVQAVIKGKKHPAKEVLPARRILCYE